MAEEGTDNMDTRPPLPIEEDVMALARLGEIGAIQKLFDSGKCDASFKDEQGITPLHWAAIKGHYALCHFLLNQGVDVNAKGGDVGATPVLWAARSCNYYTVNLLLQHGADPMATDDQGFNLLQNATMDGNVFQLVMILHYDVPVDAPDAHGHTSLMWAAYKGFPQCVEVLLLWGASVTVTDEKGFTALHWALVKGTQGCIQKLLEFGADRFVQTSDGKTPAQCAKDMNTVPVWQRSLSEAGFDASGTPKTPSWLSFLASDQKTALRRFFFYYPFAILYLCCWTISALPIYFALPAAGVVFFLCQYAGHQLLLRAALPSLKTLNHTPFLAGIFAGSLFWAGIHYVLYILPWTYNTSTTDTVANLAFLTLYGLCTYFYLSTLLEDPGFIPKSSSRSEQKAVAQDLLRLGVFDDRHFCITCMARKPLRSKHCRMCGRCVAKHDHHCPWVDNCVANNNHRHFFLYVATMWVGVLLFGYLSYQYLINRPPPNTPQHCVILPAHLCTLIATDYFTFILTVWLLLQDVWVTMLILTQLFQIARGQTTFEVMKGHPQLSGTNAAVAAGITSGTASLEGAGLTDTGAGPEASKRKKPDGWLDQWKRLLGIDSFIATALHGSRADEVLKRRRENPFHRGMVQNLRDFFFDPAPVFARRANGMGMLGGEVVDYATMYEAPRIGRVVRRGGERYEGVAQEEEDV
ncbi:MAG: hypothetical protein Q9162_001477 [Coniocarpon cinnabarinum]